MLDVASVVSHKLYDGAVFLVIRDLSTTAPRLHERLLDFVAVQIVRQTLNEGQALPGGSLHESQVDVIGVLSLLLLPLLVCSVELSVHKSLRVEIPTVSHDELALTLLRAFLL